MMYYTTENFPRLVWDRQGYPWRIYANANGDCAAIPRDATSGHKPSAFGNLAHVARIKRQPLLEFERAGMNQSRNWLSACLADPPATWRPAHYAITRRILARLAE